MAHKNVPDNEYQNWLKIAQKSLEDFRNECKQCEKKIKSARFANDRFKDRVLRSIADINQLETRRSWTSILAYIASAGFTSGFLGIFIHGMMSQYKAFQTQNSCYQDSLKVLQACTSGNVDR